MATSTHRAPVLPADLFIIWSPSRRVLPVPTPSVRSCLASPSFVVKSATFARRAQARRLVPRAEFLPTAGKHFPKASAGPRAHLTGPAPPTALRRAPRRAHLLPAPVSRPGRPANPHPAAARPTPSPSPVRSPTLRGRAAKKGPRQADPATPPRGRVRAPVSAPGKGQQGAQLSPVLS